MSDSRLCIYTFDRKCSADMSRSSALSDSELHRASMMTVDFYGRSSMKTARSSNLGYVS